ncbi:MAG: hypothetical protein WCT11_00465 [Candidatus Magasanikbacteria bacterium]
MANIINHKTTQVNFVLIPNNPINIDGIDITKIKIKLSEIFSNSKTIITQFPEVLVVFDPNNNISINVLKDQNRIIIADNTTSPYSGRPLENFFKFAKEISDITNNDNTKDYGFNILSNFDLENGTTDSGKFINENYLKTEKLAHIGNIKSAGLRIVYETTVGIRSELKIEPRFGQNLEATKNIIISHNSHFVSKPLPPLGDLNSQLQEIYNGLPGILSKIFSQ